MTQYVDKIVVLLSTPFWEFQIRGWCRVLRLDPVLCLSTPFWEFLGEYSYQACVPSVPSFYSLLGVSVEAPHFTVTELSTTINFLLPFGSFEFTIFSVPDPYIAFVKLSTLFWEFLWRFT